MTDGTVRELDHGVELCFERDFPHPIDTVWAALTEPEKMRDWLADAEIDLRVGGRVYLKGDEIESTITDLDPPKVIQYGWRSAEWDGGQIRWELEPTADGTHLVFTHTFTPMSEAEENEFRAKYSDKLPPDWEALPSNLAGWHTILSKLERALDGAPDGPSLDWRERDDDPMDGWRELNQHYKKMLAPR